MVTVFSPVWDISRDEFRRVTEVTYLGVVHGTMAALQQMRSRNRGTIIRVRIGISRHSSSGGSFGLEASSHAVVAPSPVVRLTPVVLGAALFMLLGFLTKQTTHRSLRYGVTQIVVRILLFQRRTADDRRVKLDGPSHHWCFCSVRPGWGLL
jgi:NAD(P)-dependent dehydrogenase (short-subunit alcohol dehydrogenase family)